MPPESCALPARPSLTIPAAMSQPEAECERRFRAAVDVIQSLPKNGVYRPSYEVMLRFYSLYKQAVFGPCRSSRPGFWDPVGRYKWDAWNRLGEMSSEAAMMQYVEEMKKVAQEVIDNMPVNEKTASLFHYFEPLYLVIHDMPRPPEELLNLRAELEGSDQSASPTEAESETKTGPDVWQAGKEELTDGLELSPRESSGLQVEPGPSEGLVGTSDSESDVFCDSVEQLDQKSVSWLDGVRREHDDVQRSGDPVRHCAAVSQATEAGAGQGGEGAGEGWAPPVGGRRGFSRGGSREETRGRGQGSTPRRVLDGASGEGGGDGREGGGTAHQQDAHVQQQVVSTLRQLREDMQSVMERLEAVERLAAAQAQGLEWRPAGHLAAPSTETQQESWWWPFRVSGRTALLLLLWPFLAHLVVFLLRQRLGKSNLGLRGRR